MAGKRPRWRRAFKFETEESQLHYGTFRGKPCVLRPMRGSSDTKRAARIKYLEHKMLHLLFPENAIRPVGISYADIDGEKTWGMVSEPLKKRSTAFKRFQEGYYNGAFGITFVRKDKPVFMKKTPYKGQIMKHLEFANVGEGLIDEIGKWGIRVNDHPVNIAQADGKHVFIEISSVWWRNMLNALKRMPDGAKKRELKRLLDDWRGV